MKEIFFFDAESGLTMEYTLLAVVWVHFTLSVGSSDRYRGWGVLSSLYNKDPKGLNAVYTLLDHKSMLDR
jgi:hypothetical protein